MSHKDCLLTTPAYAGTALSHCCHMHVDTEPSPILGAPFRASGPVALLLIVLISEGVCDAHIHTEIKHDADKDHACSHD